MLVPLALWGLFACTGSNEVPAKAFWIPLAVSCAVAICLKRRFKVHHLDNRGAMMLCALAWLVISAIGAIPFWLGLKMSYLDAYFETVSGFTTTGITLISGLDEMPKSILFWRGFAQWLGGLGILTFFLSVLYLGGSSAHRLFGAESHKIFSRRPAPSLLKSLRIIWLIYATFTLVTAIALAIEGLGAFDAVMHAMTSVSTGGFSSHDASIAYFSEAGFAHAIAIEYTIIVAMVLGGISFFVHFRWFRGGFRALWDSFEMKLFWLILFGATVVVMTGHIQKGIEGGFSGYHDAFRHSLFQVVSLATTTGFGTKDISKVGYYSAAAAQVFLLLMIVGGCVGSTSGGIKILRIGVLFKMMHRQLQRLMNGSRAVHPVVVDGEMVDAEELRRISALFFGWMALLAVGSLITTLVTDIGAFESMSGMFSALGNIGPCHIPPGDFPTLHPVVKVVYIFGMLAGRLEILPVLLLFKRASWR